MKIAAFKKEFDALSDKHFGEGDLHKFCSQSEWDDERCERYGTGAKLNCIIEESGWYMVLNGYSGPYEAATELRQLEEKYGVYHELGYAWSMHWYPT
jgi:hypothetical protein